MANKQKRRRFRPAEWVENEVQAMMDSYPNTREQALEFVLDLLKEGQYDEELSMTQTISALKKCQDKMAK